MTFTNVKLSDLLWNGSWHTGQAASALLAVAAVGAHLASGESCAGMLMWSSRITHAQCLVNALVGVCLERLGRRVAAADRTKHRGR